jgi:kinetochore protein NDC80
MEEHKSALETKVKERTTELAEANEKLSNTNNRIEELKNTVNTQQLSVDDLRKLENEIKGVVEATERARALKEERKKAFLRSQEELTMHLNKLETVVTDYNHKVSQLTVLVPTLSSNGSKLKLQIHKDNRMTQSPNSLLGADVSDFVRPTIEAKRDEFEIKADRSKRDHQDALDKLELVAHQHDESAAKLKIIQDKITRLTETLEQDQEAHNLKVAVRQREVEAMELKIATLRHPVAIEEQMASYERQCAELEALRRTHQEESVARKNFILSEVNMGLHLMKEHDAYWRQKNDELAQYWERKREETQGSLFVPPNINLD